MTEISDRETKPLRKMMKKRIKMAKKLAIAMKRSAVTEGKMRIKKRK